MPSLTPPARAETHLWWAPLAIDAGTLRILALTLSNDERDRAARFRFERDRSRWVAARGWLRRLLAGYLDADPTELRFTSGALGKPCLVTPAASWLRFNMAHSNDVAVVAIARDREVGVDVEALRPDVDMQSLGVLSMRERELLRTLHPRLRQRAGFEYWTRKEACLKAAGLGLAVRLSELDTSASQRGSMRLPDLDSSAPDVREWSLHGFDVGAGYVASAAVEGRDALTPSPARCIDELLAVSAR